MTQAQSPAKPMFGGALLSKKQLKAAQAELR